MSLPPRKLFPEARRLEMTQEVMESANLDPTLRPTQLTISHIRALADAYAHLCAREPHLQHYEFREELGLNHRRHRGAPAAALTKSPGLLKGGEEKRSN